MKGGVYRMLTEEGGCFGNAEAPDDDHCNPAHVWNFSFLVCP